jgi:hypothetical protein
MQSILADAMWTHAGVMSAIAADLLLEYIALNKGPALNGGRPSFFYLFNASKALKSLFREPLWIGGKIKIPPEQGDALGYCQ